jgi:hypothetical protein
MKRNRFNEEEIIAILKEQGGWKYPRLGGCDRLRRRTRG